MALAPTGRGQQQPGGGCRQVMQRRHHRFLPGKRACRQARRHVPAGQPCGANPGRKADQQHRPRRKRQQVQHKAAHRAVAQQQLGTIAHGPYKAA